MNGKQLLYSWLCTGIFPLTNEPYVVVSASLTLYAKYAYDNFSLHWRPFGDLLLLSALWSGCCLFGTFPISILNFISIFVIISIANLYEKKINVNIRAFLKLRLEMGNVSKRQQPVFRADNSRRSPTGLQCSETFPQRRRPSACP